MVVRIYKEKGDKGVVLAGERRIYFSLGRGSCVIGPGEKKKHLSSRMGKL